MPNKQKEHYRWVFSEITQIIFKYISQPCPVWFPLDGYVRYCRLWNMTVYLQCEAASKNRIKKKGKLVLFMYALINSISIYQPAQQIGIASTLTLCSRAIVSNLDQGNNNSEVHTRASATPFPFISLDVHLSEHLTTSLDARHTELWKFYLSAFPKKSFIVSVRPSVSQLKKTFTGFE
jgi:hypothetical protein